LEQNLWETLGPTEQNDHIGSRDQLRGPVDVPEEAHLSAEASGLDVGLDARSVRPVPGEEQHRWPRYALANQLEHLGEELRVLPRLEAADVNEPGAVADIAQDIETSSPISRGSAGLDRASPRANDHAPLEWGPVQDGTSSEIVAGYGKGRGPVGQEPFCSPVYLIGQPSVPGSGVGHRKRVHRRHSGPVCRDAAEKSGLGLVGEDELGRTPFEQASDDCERENVVDRTDLAHQVVALLHDCWCQFLPRSLQIAVSPDNYPVCSREGGDAVTDALL
jgi:hypothetical protein